MVNKVLAAFLVAEGFFVLGGALILTVALISKRNISGNVTIDNVAQILLLDHCPINRTLKSPLVSIPFYSESIELTLTFSIAAIANAVMVFVTFLSSLPGILLPDNRRLLKVHGWLVIASGFFTLGVGLSIWFETLKTRSMLGEMWQEQTSQVRSLLQQKVGSFFYLPPPFSLPPPHFIFAISQDIQSSGTRRWRSWGMCIGWVAEKSMNQHLVAIPNKCFSLGFPFSLSQQWKLNLVGDMM